MFTIVSNKIKQINKTNKKYKILCQPIHEAYQTNLSKTGHEFYMIQGEGIKTWDFHTKPLPPNHYLITMRDVLVPNGVEFDLILSQERYGNLQRALYLQQRIGIPIINIDHTMPPLNQNEKQLAKIKALKANYNVYITEFNKVAWGGSTIDKVIRHGIDTKVFSGWSGENATNGISVVNHFASRDIWCGWNLWKSVNKERSVSLVGENPGLSSSASSTEDLVSKLCRARYFLNTSQWSPFPLSLFEAMSVGMPVISTAKQEIPSVIKHGENGLLADTKEDIIDCIDKVCGDVEYSKYLGQNARKTILENYTIEQFVSNWNQLFEQAVEENR